MDQAAQRLQQSTLAARTAPEEECISSRNRQITCYLTNGSFTRCDISPRWARSRSGSTLTMELDEVLATVSAQVRPPEPSTLSADISTIFEEVSS